MTPTSAADEMRQRLSNSLRIAIAERKSAPAAAFRSALAAIQNAEAVQRPESSRPRLGLGAGEAPRKNLTREEVTDIVRREISDRLAAAADYDRLGRPLEAERLRAEATALEPYVHA